MNNKIKGNTGEKLAAKFLKSSGYKILHTNYTTQIGEIDIIATNGEYLVFVEVKSRFSNDFGYPSESVTYHKRNKINQTASQYIKQYMYFNVPIRFDVIEVYLQEKRINHIENAFDSYLRY